MTICYSTYREKASDLLTLTLATGASLRETARLAYARRMASELLDVLAKENLLSDERMFEALHTYFSDHWHKGYFNFAGYTSLANADITLLLCELAMEVAQTLGINVLEVLMPTVSTESINDKFEDLNPKDLNSLNRLLNTHIIGRDGDYLIPIRLINEMLESNVLNQTKIFNNYFDYDKHPDEYATLDESELSRLFRHSPLSEELIEAKRHYDELALSECSLWTQINALLKALALNSVEGYGSEEVAGQGGNIAIGHFLGWYAMLEDSGIQSSLPKALLNEIDKLERCYNFVDENGEPRIELIETCLSRRKEALSKAIKGHEKLLMTIGLSEKQHAEQLSAAQKNIVYLRKKFNQALNDGSYVGEDELGLTPYWLEELNIDFKLSSFQELVEFISTLSLDELKAFCSHQSSREVMEKNIDKIEYFIILMSQLSCEKLTVLVTEMRPYIRESVVYSANTLAISLINLNGEKTKAFIRAFDPKLKIIQSAEHLILLLRNLDNDQVSMIDDEIIIDICKQTKNTYHLSQILAKINPCQRDNIFDACFDNIVNNIRNGYHLSTIQRHLNPQQNSNLFTRCQKKLLHSLKSGWYLGEVLKYLSHQERKTFLIACRNSNKRFLGIGGDIFYCMEHLLDPHSPVEKIILKHVRGIFFNGHEKCLSLAIAITDIRLEGGSIVDELQDHRSALYQALNTRSSCISLTLFGQKHFCSQKSHVLQELELAIEKTQSQQQALMSM